MVSPHLGFRPECIIFAAGHASVPPITFRSSCSAARFASGAALLHARQCAVLGTDRHARAAKPIAALCLFLEFAEWRCRRAVSGTVEFPKRHLDAQCKLYGPCPAVAALY